MLLIENARIHTGKEPEFKGSLLIEEGKIRSVFHKDDDPLCKSVRDLKDLEILDARGAHLLPGLIDIHLHGSYGADFIRDAQRSVDLVARGLPAEGTTSFLCSLTVISHQELCSLLKEYASIQQPEQAAQFLGVHSEGPYLSQEYKALMDPRYLRDPDLQELEDMIDSANGTLKVMTIAPERNGAGDCIGKYSNQLSFMIGHSSASGDQAMQALQKGALGFTHLYNAMSQHQHRNPGCVSAALLDDQALCELICDGFHVHPDVVRVTWKVLGPERMILITDAMPGKGMPDGDYVFSNLDCVKTGNTVRVRETGRIAGSAITMLDALRNMKEFCQASFDDLARMACVNPSVIARCDDRKGSLEAGKDADLILLDDQMNLLRTVIAGDTVFSAS